MVERVLLVKKNKIMGHIIEITEDKMENLSEHIEKGLRHLGKAMQCVDEWMQEGYGERGRGMGYRDEDDRDDDEMWERGYGRGMGYRRRRDSRGRYM